MTRPWVTVLIVLVLVGIMVAGIALATRDHAGPELVCPSVDVAAPLGELPMIAGWIFMLCVVPALVVVLTSGGDS